MNSSSDARIIEHDDHEISSDIDNLELARRHGYEVENSILTVTMNDEQNLEIISDQSQRSMKSCVCSRIPIPVLLFVVSLILLVSAIVIIHASAKKNMKESVKHFLIIFQSACGFAFIGQLSYLIALKTSSWYPSLLFCERLRHREKEEIIGILKQFLLHDIFKGAAVRAYFERINKVIDRDRELEAENFLDSEVIESVVSEHLVYLYESPEGSLLNVIGVDESELRSYSKLLLQQILCKILPKIFKETSSRQLLSFDSIQGNIEEIINERLHSVDFYDINKFLQSTTRRKANRMSVVIFCCAMIGGCIYEVTRQFLQENSI
ncbi:uncharacterized protein LOC135691224 isoform X2 [Rhopilema esculentum]|uniref:uncharacterized protein LOC135691224 isoform X2 n=1 Tax=Rhopilema esculentum TaxID=499914 RepID=UPI0031DF3FD9